MFTITHLTKPDVDVPILFVLSDGKILARPHIGDAQPDYLSIIDTEAAEDPKSIELSRKVAADKSLKMRLGTRDGTASSKISDAHIAYDAFLAPVRSDRIISRVNWVALIGPRPDIDDNIIEAVEMISHPFLELVAQIDLRAAKKGAGPTDAAAMLRAVDKLHKVGYIHDTPNGFIGAAINRYLCALHISSDRAHILEVAAKVIQLIPVAMHKKVRSAIAATDHMQLFRFASMIDISNIYHYSGSADVDALERFIVASAERLLFAPHVVANREMPIVWLLTTPPIGNAL